MKADWKLRWVIGGALLSLLSFFAIRVFDDYRAIAVTAQTVNNEQAVEIKGLETTLENIHINTDEKITGLKTTIEERGKTTDSKLNHLDAQLDRLETKLDILLSRTPAK